MLVHDIINEIGNNPYPVKVKSLDKYYQVWETPDKNLRIVLSYRTPKNQPTVLETNFYTGTDQTTELTGTGDQFRILATVAQVYSDNIPKMIKEFQPQTFRFIAKSSDKGRIKLYTNRGVKLISQILGSQWKFDGVQNIQIEGNPYQLYLWVNTVKPVNHGPITKIIKRFGF